MFTKIWVKNFKAHANTKIETRRITLFIGPNNSGKSSLGQAILLLRQAATRNDTVLCNLVQRKVTTVQDPYLYSEDQLVDLGEFGDVVRKGEEDVHIGLEGTLEHPKISDPFGPFSVNSEVLVRGNKLASYNGRIESTRSYDQAVRLGWQWTSGTRVTNVAASAQGVTFQFQPTGNFTFLTLAGMQVDSHRSPEELTALQSLQQQLVQAPVSLMNSFHPIFPLRGLEERGSPLTDSPARNLERMSVSDRTVALLSMLAYDLDLQERVSDWLENLIDRRIKVPLLPGKRVTLMSVPPRSKGADSLFTNEGTGANQLPFILVPIGITRPGETISLNEPEAHLHPKMQSRLTSLLLTLSQKENRQFIIETHSEHVLHSVLHAVAKGELTTKDLAIYYFQKNNGLAKCQLLEVSEKGQVPGGLPEFFEHSLSELSDMLEAQEKN